MIQVKALASKTINDRCSKEAEKPGMKTDPVGAALRYAGLCAMIAGLAAIGVSIANAQSHPTCSAAAHAYACCQISKLSTVEFLKSCVHDSLKNLGAAGREAESKPPANVKPLTCHDYAAQFSTKPESLSAGQLVYLEACVDADIGYRRKGP